MIESICTIATAKSASELSLMEFSFRKYNPDIPIYIYGDSDIKSTTDAVVSNIIEYDETEWLKLMLTKMGVMELALSNHSNTLFVDADIIWAGRLNVDVIAEVMLSPHYIDKHETDKHGYYNGGYVFTSNKKFPKWWRNAPPLNPKCFEQGCLEETSKFFDIACFDPEHNYGWFRVSPWHSSDYLYRMMELQDGRIRPISFHTHLNSKEGRFAPLNKYLRENLDKDILYYANSVGLI